MNREHVDNLNSIQKLEQAGFDGPDVSLAESIFEYGIAWQDDGKETLFIHRASHSNRFDRTTFESDLDVEKEFNWIRNWDSFFSSYGTTRDEWIQRSLGQKLFDLMLYYGVENIFGTSYWEGFTIAD